MSTVHNMGMRSRIEYPDGDIAYRTVCSCGWFSENTSPSVVSIMGDKHVSNVKTGPEQEQETIAEEAQRIVYGDREQAYDDPNRNFRKIAYMVNGVLDEKLKESGSITPNDVALILECLKISRESFKPNRENRVDGIGYWLCLERIVEAGNKDVE